MTGLEQPWDKTIPSLIRFGERFVYQNVEIFLIAACKCIFYFVFLKCLLKMSALHKKKYYHSMEKITAIFPIILLLWCIGCHSNTKLAEGDTTSNDTMKVGKIVDLTGLGACSWAIELANGQKVEPINFSDFKIELANNKKVKVAYEEMPDMASACMVGPIVKITDLRADP